MCGHVKEGYHDLLKTSRSETLTTATTRAFKPGSLVNKTKDYGHGFRSYIPAALRPYEEEPKEPTPNTIAMLHKWLRRCQMCPQDRITV